MPSTSPVSKKRILFVCMGNICRSPAAECVMRSLVQKAGLEDRIECDSAGTIDYNEGKQPDPRMRQAGAIRHIAIKGTARQVVRADLEDFDLIVAMDEENVRDLRALNSDQDIGERIQRFCDYCTEHHASEVPDPYYGGDDGFETVLDLLEDGCSALVEQLKSEFEA